jgi:short-subunit dehydrogenase
MFMQEGRWALITGGTKGIGWAIAEKFASEGIHVILSSRSKDDLEKKKEDLSKYEVKAEVFPADVSNREEVKALATFVKETAGQLDILVNNAGVFFPGEVLKEEEGSLEKMIETNLYSAYYLTRYVLSLLERSPRANIINMCSVASTMAYPNGGSYSISKFAMLGMSKAQREELKSSTIGVTAIMPGATWSASWAGADLPRERLMEASNIADLCFQVVQMAPNATVEEIVIRPQLGDL